MLVHQRVPHIYPSHTFHRKAWRLSPPASEAWTNVPAEPPRPLRAASRSAERRFRCPEMREIEGLGIPGPPPKVPPQQVVCECM